MGNCCSKESKPENDDNEKKQLLSETETKKAPLPQPESQPKPRPKPQPESQPKPRPKPQPESRPKPQPESQPQPRPKPQPESRLKPQPEPQPKPQPEPQPTRRPIEDTDSRESRDSIQNKDWYHEKISADEAESRMKSAQEKGSYLVYDSSEPGVEYMLLVKVDGDILKLAITKRNSLYTLQGGASSHKSVQELIKAHRGIYGSQIKYNDHPPFRLRKASFADKKWYHKKILPDEADKRLMKGAQGINGSYLVYDHPHEDGNYVLLVYFKSTMQHANQDDEGQCIYRWKISKTINGKYIMGEAKSDASANPREYKSVRELIKSHRGATGKPIRLTNGDLVTLSKSYVMRT